MTKRPVGLMWYLVSRRAGYSDDRLDNVFQDFRAQLIVAHDLGVLGRDHDRIHPERFPVGIVFHGHL